MAQSRFSALLKRVRLFFTGSATPTVSEEVGHQFTVGTVIGYSRVSHQFEIIDPASEVGHEFNVDGVVIVGKLGHQFNVDSIDYSSLTGHQFDVNQINVEDLVAHQFTVDIVSRLGHQFDTSVVARLGHQFTIPGALRAGIPTLLRVRQEGHNSIGKVVRFYNGSGTIKAEHIELPYNVSLGVKTGSLLIDTKSDTTYSISSASLSGRSAVVYRVEGSNKFGKWAVLDEEGE